MYYDMREELCIQKCLMGRLVEDLVMLMGRAKRMDEDRLKRNAYYLHHEKEKKMEVASRF